MKNILVLSGSHMKKGTGMAAFEAFKRSFDENEYAFEVIHLSDKNIEFCKGCGACFKMGESFCPLKDDVSQIAGKMEAADALIFISPVYAMDVSGQFKTLMDRTAYMLHRPKLYGKYGFVIISTDLAGIGPVASYLKYMQNAYSMGIGGHVGVHSKRFKEDMSYRENKEEVLRRKAKDFMDDINKGKTFKPSFFQLVRFNAWRIKASLSENIYPADYEFWKENDWFDKAYYYPVSIGPIKRIFLNVVKKRLGRMIKKSLCIK